MLTNLAVETDLTRLFWCRVTAVFLKQILHAQRKQGIEMMNVFSKQSRWLKKKTPDYTSIKNVSDSDDLGEHQWKRLNMVKRV